MSEDYLFRVEDGQKLVDGFFNCTLPKEEWTHEAHLIAGLYLLAHFPETAMEKMRAHLLAYNESVGGVNDDHNGYHETMTAFWLWAIRFYQADELGKLYWSNDALDALLFEERLAERNIWLEYYSKERMMSVEARRNLVEPDLKPLPDSTKKGVFQK